MREAPDNSDDVIDSRDVIDRIEELESELTDAFEEASGDSQHPLHDEAEEYRKLKDLAEQGEGYGDWAYGETLIRDSYFQDYAQQLAEDIGAVKSDAGWPNNCIDWEKAARELKQDYTCVDFDGVTFYMRS